MVIRKAVQPVLIRSAIGSAVAMMMSRFLRTVIFEWNHVM
jgi:hypothetical protein